MSHGQDLTPLAYKQLVQLLKKKTKQLLKVIARTMHYDDF